MEYIAASSEHRDGPPKKLDPDFHFPLAFLRRTVESGGFSNIGSELGL